MKTRLNCPCGEYITAPDEDELVKRVEAHLASEHPDRHYGRDEILFMAS
jgi:predicted small metal-binding protein